MKRRKRPSLYTPVYHIRCHSNAWWIKYDAVTWFGHIHFKCGRDELERLLLSPSMLEMERHERIHILQAHTFKTGYLGFYITYLYYWSRNVFRYGFNVQAYYNIPFEREAYAMENAIGYDHSEWRKWIR